MRLAVLFLFSLFFNSGFAQYNSLLWEISGNGLEKPSYLFGTIHLIPKSDYLWTEAMDRALKSSQVLVMEVDMEALSFSDKMKLATDVVIPDGKTLDELMGHDSYESWVASLVDSLGLKERKIRKRYNRILPFYLQGLILKDYLGKVKMYEKELGKISKRKKLGIMGLESIEFQMSLIKNFSIEEQIEMLADISSVREYFAMVDIYVKQDLDELERFSVTMMTEASDGMFMMEFLEKRNKNWIPLIEEMIAQQTCFIAVGALHLPGRLGLIELLIEEGYTVRAIK